MSDLPENLQIKREPSPPSTPEDKSPNNIKAKLNLHVKRRLQDYNQTTEDTSTNNSQLSPHQQQKPLQSVDIKQEPSSQKPSEVVRQKRPYNKRTDKQKSSQQQLEATNLATSTSTTAATTPQRKYKHKIKQIVANDNAELLNASNASEEALTSGHNVSITTGAISAGDDDEVAHDNELKGGREKEKCPDVLAMVLSMKKRALMQDPEVQNFLKEVMDVIKS